jgi:uncharacterized protein (DUF885 family)
MGKPQRLAACLSSLAGLWLLAGCDTANDAPPRRAEGEVSTLSAPLRASNAEAAELYRIVETYFDQYLALNPIFATQIGDHRFDDRFGDYVSMSWMADSLGIEQESLERLQSIDRQRLEGEDRFTYDAFRLQRELSIGGYRYPSELLALHHVEHWPVVFAQLGSGRDAQPFRNTADYDAFLERMDGFVGWVDQVINNLRAGVTKGVVLPQVVVERILPQLEAFARTDEPRQTIFWQPLFSLPAGPTVAERRRLLQAYDEKLRTRVLPAYRRLHDYLAQEYLPHARGSVGWSSLPSGDLWYAHLVRYYTTLELTPSELHELGLREVARLRTQIEVLQGPLGIAGNSSAGLEAMRADPRVRVTADRSVRAAHRALLERRATLSQQTQPNLPRFRRFGNDAAYVDGWAAYSRSVGNQPAVLDGFGPLGALGLELLDAARLVVDTGLHAQGWNRQRAVDYLRANTSLGEAEVEADVDRCIAMPGRALAARIGFSKIIELRRRAEQQLGERFDVRDFDEQLLGGVPCRCRCSRPGWTAGSKRAVERRSAQAIREKAVPIRSQSYEIDATS